MGLSERRNARWTRGIEVGFFGGPSWGLERKGICHARCFFLRRVGCRDKTGYWIAPFMTLGTRALCQHERFGVHAGANVQGSRGSRVPNTFGRIGWQWARKGTILNERAINERHYLPESNAHTHTYTHKRPECSYLGAHLLGNRYALGRTEIGSVGHS